ncbi:MAG: hypothetical protein PSX71_13955 [bacterium]|nr:hypothetical protein [bacterium]
MRKFAYLITLGEVWIGMCENYFESSTSARLDIIEQEKQRQPISILLNNIVSGLGLVLFSMCNMIMVIRSAGSIPAPPATIYASNKRRDEHD